MYRYRIRTRRKNKTKIGGNISKKKIKTRKKGLDSLFKNIYVKDKWQRKRKIKESVSGPGSFLKNTINIRKELPILLERFNIKTMLDIPCGDLNWISKILPFKNTTYIGADIVEDLIKKNKIKYPKYDFYTLDLVSDELPKVDLIMCRDILVHLSFENIALALENIRKSGIKYLLATSFSVKENKDIRNGQWRAINLKKFPFKLGKPIYKIIENEKYKRKGTKIKINKEILLFELN